MKFLVKVWTRNPFYPEGFTEIIDETRLDTKLVAQVAGYLSHAAANCSIEHEAVVTIYKRFLVPAVVGEAKIMISPGLTIRKGKAALRNYTPEVSRFVKQVKNKVS